MATEKTNPKDHNWKRWHAYATHTTETVHVYTWTCPDCTTVNHTRVNLESERTRHCYRGVEARCGKCHASKRRLTDKSGMTFDPNVS
jgi:hypothetical protein